MSSQIIRQPVPSGSDPLFCIWSTVVDNIVLYDASHEDVLDYFAEQAAESARRDAQRLLDKLDADEKPYHQFTITFAEALDEIEERHGKAERRQVEDMILGAAVEPA